MMTKQIVGVLALGAMVLVASAQAQSEHPDELNGLTEGLASQPSSDTTTTCQACGDTYRVATTNGVATTINNPKNCGESNACTLTLKCIGSDGRQVGTGLTLPPGVRNHSFSCGADAVKITMTCDTGNECKLCYTTPGKAAVEANAEGQFVFETFVSEFLQ